MTGKKFKFKSEFELRMGNGLFPVFCHSSLCRVGVGGRKCECEAEGKGKVRVKVQVQGGRELLVPCLLSPITHHSAE